MNTTICGSGRATSGALEFGVAEHEMIMESLCLAVVYDQGNVVNSFAFEVFLHRAQRTPGEDTRWAHQRRRRTDVLGVGSRAED